MKIPIKVKVLYPTAVSVGTVIPQNDARPEAELEWDKDGIVATMVRNGRKFLIPWTNIINVEFEEVKKVGRPKKVS